MDSNVKAPTTSVASWKLNGNIASCEVSTTEGYTLVANKITYIPNNKKDNFTVNGVKSTDGLELNGMTVTVSNAALSNSTVTVSDGYELKLGNDVNKAATTSPTWSYDKGTSTATYTSGLRSEGYLLEDNHISYVSAIGSEEVKISGITSRDGITVEDKIITIPASILNKKPVTVNNQDYTLKLGTDVPAPIAAKAGWTLDNNTAIYKTASTTEGYSVKDNQIVYSEASGETLVTVTGVKDVLGLALNDKVVTVYDSALDGSEVKISDDYELAFGEDVKRAETKTDWIIDGDNLTYQENATSAGYKLSTDKKTLSYAEAVAGEIKVELSGVEGKPTVTHEAKSVVQLTADNFSEEGVSLESNGGKYELEIMEGDYATDTKFFGSEDKDSVTNAGNNLVIDLGAGVDKLENSGDNVKIDGGLGNDKINNKGAGVSITGGKGNDNITLSGGNSGNIFIYNKSDGKDILTNVSEKDTIKIVGNDLIEANVKNSDVVFTIGTGSITFKNAAAKGTTFNVIDSADNPIEAISGNTYSREGVINGEAIILSSTFDSIYTADKVELVDGSQLTRGISIDGGSNGVSLIGGVGKDTLISGTTDGFELTGGKGNDIFVYKGGKGSITDYSQKGTKGGKDKIEIDAGLTLKNFEIEGSNIILDYGAGNELTLEGIKETTEITFGTKSSVVRTFKEVGVFDDRGKAVSLTGSTESFSALKYSKLETIDGSFTDEINIEGNKKANYIVAAKENSTLSGGRGKDTLVGGAGNDIFVYEAKSGNKLIQKFNSEQDKISLKGGAVLSEVKTVNKTDLELKVGNNKITIDGSAGKEFTFFEDGAEKTFTTKGLLVNGESASLTGSFSGKATDLAEYKYLDASLMKKAVTLTGGGKIVLSGVSNGDKININGDPHTITGKKLT